MGTSMGNKIDLGLLILRLGVGVMLIYHGFPKIMGGPQVWDGLGKAMGVFGITFLPKFWGFMAAFAECFGGVALILGVLTAPFCILLVIDMIVASAMHISKGEGLMVASHAIELGIVFLALIFIGPGKYKIGKF